VIKDMNIQWYREQIAIVSQEPRLFDGTVAQNILYGKPGASVEEMESVRVCLFFASVRLPILTVLQL